MLLACVLIATVLWFLRAFENEYTTRVVHPVRYINLPENMVTLNTLPQRISLEVKGLGFSILKHNWNFSKTPLTIDLNRLKTPPAGKRKGHVELMPMNLYFNDFSVQLKELKVVAVYPDTLTFRLAFNKTRTLKVVPVILYDSGAFFIPDSLVSVKPATVSVEGPDLILDTLRSVRTVPIKISRQGGPFSRSMSLEEIHEMVRLNPDKVTVTIKKP